MSIFSDDLIARIWEKGFVVEGIDENLFRKDACGAWIARTKYGDVSNEMGWVIDHVYPVQLGGGNDDINLRPMNWQNDRSKSVDYPSYYAAVTSEGLVNTENTEVFVVNTKLQEKLAELYSK